MSSAQPLKEKVDREVIKRFLGRDAPNWHVYLLLIIIYVIPHLIDVSKSLLNKQSINVSQNVEQVTQTEQTDVKGDKACKDFPNFGTDISYENMWYSDGLYQPKGLSYKEGTVWINEAVIPKFKSIFIEYQILENQDTADPPSLIITLVEPKVDTENTKVGKFWIPEYSISMDGKNKTLQLLGRSFNGQDRQDPIELQFPVKTNQVDTVEIETLDTDGKQSVLNLIYTYTSDDNNDTTVKKFTQTATWSVSNLDNSSKLIDIGFGVFKGYRLKIESIRVCE